MRDGGIEGDVATIVLVRHGETDWNRDRRVQGWAPVPLNDRGRRQVARLAKAIDDRYEVDRLVSSDLRRALETARPIARLVGVTVEPDRAWRERDFGVMQGLGYRDLFEGYPEYALTEVGYAAARATPEGGERLLDHRDRVLAGFDRLVASIDPDETAVVVTHGGPLYFLLGWLKGIDVIAAVVEQEQDNCAITELTIETATGAVAIGVENDTEYRGDTDA
ncbi:MAG: histidine phosphatase family protein [Halobacteriota archaeon]